MSWRDRIWAAIVLSVLVFGGQAEAQTSPGFLPFQTLTATNLNTAIAAKVDYNAGGIPVASGGTGTTAAGATAAGNIGALAQANNLSDVANAATSLTNIGGLAKMSNLSDVSSASTALGNLGGLPLAGGTLTGKLTTPAGTTAAAPLNVPQGSGPTSPVNGDLWTTSSGVFARIAGATQTLGSTGIVASFNSRTGAVTLTSGDVTGALGFGPLNAAGGTMTGQLVAVMGTTSAASINVPPGAAPTSPANGDLWDTTAGFFGRINGVTGQFATTANSLTSFNTRTGAITLSSGDVTGALTYTPANVAGQAFTGRIVLPASTTGGAFLNLPQGAVPTSPINGDLWTTSSGAFAQIAGTTQQLATISGAVTSFNTRTGSIVLTSGDVTTALAYTPANAAGQTFTGEIIAPASTTGTAGLNIGQGSAPTSPVNGDEWITTGGRFARVNGVTQQYLAAGNNLSDVASPSSTRTNLGVTATGGDTTYAFRANNLSDLGSVSSARTNLGLGTASTANTGSSGGTLPFLNTANTWSNVQTFGNSDILLLGSSTGSTTLTSANASASNFTITVPAATDTLVTLGATQTLTNKLLTSPAETGTPTVPTATAGTNTTQTASTAFTTGAIATAVSTLAPIASPAFTGSTPTSGGTALVLTNDSRFSALTQNAQTSSYTLVLADAGKSIYMNCASTATLTIPANSSVAFGLVTAVQVIAGPTCTVTIAITTDTLNLSPAGTTGSRTLAAFGAATLSKVATTRWYVSGGGLT